MKYQSLLGLIVVVLCHPAVDSSEVSWLGSYNWAAVTKLGADVTFGCVLKDDNGTDALPMNHSVVAYSESWKLPNIQQLDQDYIGYIDNRYIDGDTLTVVNVTMEDKGIYLCHVALTCTDEYKATNNGSCEMEERWFKHGLNLNGPIYANLLDKYQMNFIVGAASAGGVTAVFALLCLIYKFRHKEAKNNDPIELSRYTGEVNAATSEDHQM